MVGHGAYIKQNTVCFMVLFLMMRPVTCAERFCAVEMIVGGFSRELEHADLVVISR